MLTTMRLGCCAVLALSACYAPTVLGGAPCDLNRDSCPSGQTCQAAGAGNFCLAEGGHIDAGSDSTTTTIDGGGLCLGKGLLGSVCLQNPPTAAVTLTAATPINTTSVSAGGCTEIRPQTGGPSLCIIAGTTIDIPTGVTVRAIAVNQSGAAATTTNPIVLVATKSITIEGTLDVASHVGDLIAGMPVLGAGARTAVGCAAIGLDGAQGRAASSNSSFGGGGAAGGSMSSTGGAGGAGGNGDAGMGAGLGGGGGGAVYLLAGDSITVSGKITASGGGGDKGIAGNLSSGGGGGGGSGGLIGLEALHITVTGALLANGGGGGAGNGGNAQDTGTPGSDPTAALTAAPGGVGKNGGGNGGAGSTGTAAGTAGKNGSGSLQETAGGGGGGGAGAIRVFGVPPSSLTGTISPPAS